MFKLGLYWLSSLSSIILIPLYVCMAPVCMISSSLFDWLMSWVVEDQTITLIGILIFEWTVSALLIFQLMVDRAGKSIFFYEFIFFIVCANFILIGITYSLLHRYNIIEEFAAKICTTLLLILLAEKLKMKFKEVNELCVICCEQMNQECIILKCSHFFHEKCLWEWAYVKQECPSCKRPMN